MPIMHFVLCLQPLHENTLSRQKVGKESTLDFRPLPQAGEGSSKTAKSRFLPLFFLPETDLNPFLTFDFFLFFHLAHLICAHSAFSFGRPDFLFCKKKKWAWTRRDSNPRPRDVLERACVLANHARYHCATSPSGGSTGFCGPIGPGTKKSPNFHRAYFRPLALMCRVMKYLQALKIAENLKESSLQKLGSPNR